MRRNRASLDRPVTAQIASIFMAVSAMVLNSPSHGLRELAFSRSCPQQNLWVRCTRNLVPLAVYGIVKSALCFLSPNFGHYCAALMQGLPFKAALFASWNKLPEQPETRNSGRWPVFFVQACINNLLLASDLYHLL